MDVIPSLREFTEADEVPDARNKRRKSEIDVLIEDFLRSDMDVCFKEFKDHMSAQRFASLAYQAAKRAGGACVHKRGLRVYIVREGSR